MYQENPNSRGSERNATPLQRILLHPEKFDPDKLTVNELQQPDGTTFAKIPKFPGRITRRKKANSDEYYIELILSHRYDPETRQNRNKKVIIGEDISYFLKGMMVINDNYHEYITPSGLPRPQLLAQWNEEDKLQRQRDQEAQKEAAQQNPPQQTDQNKPLNQTTAQQNQQNQTTDQRQPANIPDREEEASEVQIRELKAREEELDRREEELNQREAELDNEEMSNMVLKGTAAEDHISLLRDILNSHTLLIETQAKRRPDKPMSLREIQTINEILLELKTIFSNNEIENYLHLAQEPDEAQNTPATTYGEMSLLLNTYSSMLHYYAIGRLRRK